MRLHHVPLPFVFGLCMRCIISHWWSMWYSIMLQCWYNCCPIKRWINFSQLSCIFPQFQILGIIGTEFGGMMYLTNKFYHFQNNTSKCCHQRSKSSVTGLLPAPLCCCGCVFLDLSCNIVVLLFALGCWSQHQGVCRTVTKCNIVDLLQ